MTQDTKLVRGQHSANEEVLSAIKDLSEKTNHRFDEIFEIVTFIKDNVPTRDEVVMKSEFEDRMSEMKNQMATKSNLAKLECRMVTKSYLDDKLADVVAEIGTRINRVKDKGKEFNQKLVTYLDRHSVFENNEISKLKELI